MCHDRAEARTQVIYDTRLSFHARVLYYALDEFAGQKGVGWPKRSTLAATIGLSEREIARSLRELEAANYISTTIRRYSRLYTLFWSNPEVTIPSPLESRGDHTVTPEVTIPSPLIKSVGSIEPDQGTCTPRTEESRSVAVLSTTPPRAPDRPTDPPPVLEEPLTPEDQLLIGLVNRGLPTDSYLTTKVATILGGVPVEFFLLEILDRKLRRKHRLRLEFDLVWLLQAARDAVSAWRASRVASEWRTTRAVAAIA
jgi:Helix-turn-helix domain